MIRIISVVPTCDLPVNGKPMYDYAVRFEIKGKRFEVKMQTDTRDIWLITAQLTPALEHLYNAPIFRIPKKGDKRQKLAEQILQLAKTRIPRR